MRSFSVLGWGGWQSPSVTDLLERTVTITARETLCSIRSNCRWRNSRKSFILILVINQLNAQNFVL